MTSAATNPKTPTNTKDKVEPVRADRTRQVVVTVSVVLAVLGALVGSGAIGGQPMSEAAGGAFSADATPIAPGSPAFSIWSVIYVGLVAYAAWQWFPSQAAVLRHRRIGYWITASMLLNAAWLLAVQADQLWLTLVLMAALLIVLIVTFVLLQRIRPTNGIDAVITDGTVGLYLGWIIVATAANIAAVLAAWGFRVSAPDLWAIVVLVVAGLIGNALANWSNGRLAPSAATAWGLVWVGIARLTGDLVAEPVAWTAYIMASALVIVTVIVRIVYWRKSDA